MTEFLWPGDSEYCICTHRVTEHDTRDRLVVGELGFWDIKLQEYYICVDLISNTLQNNDRWVRIGR